jgi:hypothetical protein
MNIASHPETNGREPVELPPVEQSPAIVSRAGVKTKIPGPVVNRATEHLSDRERSAIRRYHAHYVENDLNIREAAALIRISETAISQVFNGKYPSKLDSVVKAIESFFELEDERAQGRELAFTHTTLSDRIFKVCSGAREFQKIGFIYGKSQSGKSTNLVEFARQHNHGSTVYVPVPAGGSFTNFLYNFCKPLRIPINTPLGIMRYKIIESFDGRMLAIFDEIHQTIGQAGRGNNKSGIQCIEFIRELYNAKKCGIVAAGTPAFKKELEQGAYSKLLEQFKLRRLCTLMLPDAPPQVDLDLFAAKYGLPPSSGEDRALEKRIVNDEALGMWLTYLRMGAKLAATRNEPMSWRHIHLADTAQKGLEGKKF